MYAAICEAFLLSELGVGAQGILPHFVHMLREVQEFTGCVVPLVVDENNTAFVRLSMGSCMHARAEAAS